VLLAIYPAYFPTASASGVGSKLCGSSFCEEGKKEQEQSEYRKRGGLSVQFIRNFFFLVRHTKK